MVSTFIGLLDIQSWWEIPCISHFCSLFSSAFDLPDIDIEDLESALLCDGTDYQVGLVPELTVRLLKGIDALKCVANDITTSNYQMFLRRFLRQQCRALNIENHFDTDIDFQSLAVRKRLLILHELCHFRLHSRDVELIFSNLEADSLRVEPLGYDSKNSGYWYFYGTRLYREDTKQNNKTKIWQVICFTEEDWQNLASKFKSATNEKERTLYYILTENFLPKLPQLFREREKLRRKKLSQTRNSSRIRNLVEAKARQEKERAKEERYQRARAEQRLVLEPPRLLTSKSRRRRSQSTSTASGISTYASSIRPPTNSSDFLYQRETFCLTPDDLGADTPSSISPNRIERISEANSKEDYYNSDSENQQDSIEVQSSPPPSPAPPIKKRKSKKSKSSKSSKKSHRNKEARNRSPSITEDKENCGYISETESDSEVCMMPPTTNLKLPGRQTNNSLSSLPGNIFIPPLSDGKEPETSTRKSSNSGKTSTTVKKQKNQKLSVIPSTSSASKERSRSLTTKSDRNGRNKKKSTSKTSTEEPMDLLKMEDKLDNGEYTKLSEFRNDFKLIVNNCRLYNGLDNGKYAGALEYSDMVNNLHEAFAKATKKFVDHLSDDDDESSNLNYPNTKTKVFREKYRKVENSDSDEESDNSKSLRKKNLRKKESRKDSEDDIDESEDDEGVVDIATPSGSRPTKRKRKDKEKRRKKKSKTRIVEQSSDDDNWSSGEEVQPKRRKETSNGSSGKKTKKRSAKTSSKKNDQHRKKQRRMRGASSRNLGRNNSSDDESEIDDSKKYQKQSVKSNRKGTHINQNSYNLQGDTIKKRKIRTKKTISRSHSKIATKKVKKENDDSDSDDNSDESSSRSRSISPFKVDLHKKYATSTLNDEVNDDEYNETDFKSVSTQSTSRESSVDRSQNNSKDFKPSTSKEHIKKTNIKNKSITGNTLNQTPKKKEKPPEPVKEPPPFLDKYDLIKQRRNRAQTTNEDKTNNNNITKKDTKKAEATITSASSSRSKPSKESDDKPKAKIKEVTEEKPTVKEEKPTVKEEKPTVKEEKPTAKEEKPTVKEKKPSKTPAVEEKKRRVSIEATEPLKEAHDVQETAKPKSSNNRTPKKSGTSSTSKKTPKDPEKPPSGKKKIVLPPSPAPVEQIKSDSSQAQSKSTNLEALELETEQTLKDINRWLEHTPRFPEFSSASNSPTRYTALLDDFDSVSNKLDPTDFRRPIPIATPKIDLVPKFDESLDSFVAEAEVPNNKKDLISDLIPTTCSESVSSCYATPPHSSNSNISAGSISISALSISSSATLLPDIPQKSKEPSTTVLISNPPPPPHIKNQMQKEAKRKSLKEKLSAAVNSRKKDVIGTIDRLKPGKTKGNLIQNVPKQDELANSSLTPLQKVKDVKNALIVDTDDTVPKLSLGSVLDTDGFGLGHSHNFGDKESSDIVDEISDDNLKSIIEEDLRPTEPKKTFSLDAPFEAKKVSNPEPKGDSSSGTPDLSAWLKAFGVPKKTKKSEEEDNKPTSQLKALTCNTETTTSDKCADTGTGTANVLKSPSSSENNFSQPPPRQRKASTGSTISERSSFSQDPDSPRIAIDERYGSYSGNYTSPIGASPIGASPIMVSPKPDEMGKSNSPYPLNGTIKVGFYQDTTTKSSPEKSCSPRELPSPYPQYSQHIYSSTSSPNVSTTEMSGNSPYGANSYAPSAGSDSSKTPAYSSSSPIPNLYEQYKQPHSQESDYNSSMSPSTPNPHSPYQAGANSPYQCSAQSPYQNQSSPYQQQTSTTSQVTQQPAAGSTSLQFPSAIIEQSGTSSSISNTSENPAVESQQQNSPFQQTASSSFQQQQQTSTYATNSVGTNFQSNAGVFPEAVNNTTQQSNESTTLSNNTTAQSAPQISPQSNHRTFDETSQFHGYQQQSCQQQPQQQQQQTQNTTIGTLYSLNKGSDWTISQVSEQFQPPTYSQYTLAAINKELSTQKSEDQFLSQKHQPQNSIVSTLKRHLEGDGDVLKPDYNAKMPKRDDNSQPQQQSNKQPHLYDNFMNAVNYGKQLDVASNKTFEMFNRSANMGFPKDYTSATAVKDPSLQFHQQQQESQQQQSQQNQQQQEQQQHTNSQQQTQQTSVMDNSLINKPLNMANSSTYSQQQMHQQVQHHQSQDLYNKSQNSFPTNLSQPSTTAIEKPNESLISHLSLYKTQTYGSPTSMLNINHSTVSNVIDESILGINQNSSSATATTMGGVSYFDKNMPPAAHMNISSAPIYQNLNPYTGHSSTIAREQSQQQQQQQQQIQSNNYGAAITNSTNSVPSSSQSMDIMPLETKTTTKKTRTRKKASNSTTATTGDGTGKNTSAVSQAPLNSTGIQNTQLTPANTQQQMNLHHSQMQNIQGFQLYAGLKSGVNPTTNIPPATSSDASAISLKTTSVAAGSSMVPGSAFNFGPSPATLGLSTAGIYGDNTSYLDQFRDTSNPYYIPTPTHRPATTDSGGTDKPNNGTPASYPFLTHPSTRTPPFNPFVNTPQLDANSPFYQQYLQHQGDFRARMMQGLLAPGGPSAYPQPGAYRPSGIGIPKPYDINRQPWF